jgi:hypothetical protein
METFSSLTRPETFDINREYFIVERRGNGRQQSVLPVRFYAYDPCPAFIIVCTQMGDKLRCSRDELFIHAFE